MDIPDSTTFKRCTKCGEWKPRDQFHASKNGKYGLASQCKPCACETTRAWRRNNLQRARDNARIARQNNLKKARESDRAYYQKNKQSRLDYINQWRENNPTYAVEYSRRYRRENTDKVRETKRRIYKQNVDSILDYQRNYRIEQADKIRRYRKDNVDKSRVNSQRRRARKRLLPDEFTAADWQIALDYFGGGCAVCGRQPGLWHTLAADHWIPLSKGGPTTPDNIVPLCHGTGGCNNSKNDSLPANWLIEKFGKRKGRAILKRIEAFLDSRRPAS